MKKYTATIEMPDEELEDCRFCKFDYLNKLVSPPAWHCLLDLNDKNQLCPLAEIKVYDD